MEIVNRVAESDLTVFDLGALWDGAPMAELDIAPWLHRGFVLREKDFRAAVSAHDWAAHADQHVAVQCSTDALVPPWAWMLVASKLRDAGARRVTVGREADLRREHFSEALAALDLAPYRDRIVMVKGCGAATVPPSAYADAMQRLMGVARKVMYGEPCSSVPLWRRSEVKGPRSEVRDGGLFLGPRTSDL
jgi:hypothetical protein